MGRGVDIAARERAGARGASALLGGVALVLGLVAVGHAQAPGTSGAPTVGRGAGAASPPPPATAPPAPASADAPLDRKQSTQRELEAIARDIQLGSEREAQIRVEIDALDKDRVRISDKLVVTAARVQRLETDIGATETRIGRIEDRAAALRASLAARRAVLSEVLAALQRIGRKPPPAVAVRPEDALSAVRSAILLGAVLPELRSEAEALAIDLSELVRLRDRAAAERDAFRADVAMLAEERGRLEILLEQRKANRSDQQRKLDEERRRAAELAGRAGNLKDLIARLETDIETSRRAAEAARQSEAAAKARDAQPRPDGQERLAALADPGRLEPSVQFASRRGNLALPVVGRIQKGFGDDDGFGGVTRGVTITTGAGARVTSPADGWIVYAGAFRSYGQLLIINVGGGYHLVLAGMDRIDVELGQFVLAGEPVGVMGTRKVASAGMDGAAVPSSLFVEFRKDGVSIDPGPWWAQTQDEKVRG